MATSNIPTWINAATGESVSVIALARFGYEALIDAALLASSSREPDGSFRSAGFDPGRFGAALGGFWHRLRVPLLGVTGESEDYFGALERQVRDALGPSVHVIPKGDNPLSIRLHMLGLSALHKAGQSHFKRAFDLRCAQEAMARLELVGRSYWWDTLPELDIFLRFGRPLPWQAGTLVQACHEVLRKQAPEAGLTKLDFAALTLIGATVQQVAVTKRCTDCFRWAAPGTTTCADHAPRNDGADADPPRRNTTALARQLAHHLYGDAAPATMPVYASWVGIAFWLARTLLPMPVDHDHEVAGVLMQRVVKMPDLLEAMCTTPERLHTETLLMRLQRHIDPLEVRPAAWHEHVELANAWLHWERYGRLPRAAARTLRKSLLIQHAIEAARNGGGGRNAVARSIGVHPTCISQWLRRGGADPEVQRLVTAMDPALQSAATTATPKDETPTPREIHAALSALASEIASVLSRSRA